MGNLDFSDLTDDQIVELAVGLAHESMRRNPALVAAFQNAIITEKERIEAAAAAASIVKKKSLLDLRKEQERIQTAQLREQKRQERRDKMAIFLRKASEITGRDVCDLTLCWNCMYLGNGPRLHLNAGTTGDITSWHLVEYRPDNLMLKTSPGLRSKTSDLLVWARETIAALEVLNLNSIVLNGVEL